MKLKFITINLWFGGLLMDDILNFLEQEDADIVVLQEVQQSNDPKLPSHYRTVETLQSRLQYPHENFAPAIYDKYPWGNVLNGNAVLSKFPITSSNISFFDQEIDMEHPRNPFDPQFYPTSPRNLQHVVLDTPAGSLNVFNLQGVWDLDGDSASPLRQKMRDTILREIDGKTHVIVAGDTNAKYTNPVMRTVEEKLTNVFGDDLTTSFNMRRKDNPGYGTAVVDMIYINEEFSVVSKQCPDVDISDHLPLIATLEIKS